MLRLKEEVLLAEKNTERMNKIESDIKRLDTQIDEWVYELYELTQR